MIEKTKELVKDLLKKKDQIIIGEYYGGIISKHEAALKLLKAQKQTCDSIAALIMREAVIKTLKQI